MRICCRCNIKMAEGFDIKVEGGGYGIVVSDRTGIFAKRIEKPKVAICPECGEVSLYIENTADISKSKK
ncbi:MAG: nucleic acid-binding protein [Clostridiales bacterium]|nr:nucleic acid-binding protein [Clostridiales bacterium]